jgi:polyphosphate kinase
MGEKRAVISDEMDGKIGFDKAYYDKSCKEICKAQCKKEQKRAKKGKKKRVPVWVKEDVLTYQKELRSLQIELLKLQNHVKAQGLKVLVIFEGRDAAGKGGTIKRVTEHLNPRGARIVALNKPSDVEKTQWYFQRYVQHLPSGGEMVFFDRSWYNRAGVEPVMGFCTPDEHQEFLHEVPNFERRLVNSGITLIKLYFSVSKEEQAKRFEERATNLLKQYKLSSIDRYAQEYWDKFTVAEYTMFMASHTDDTPWTVIRSDNKKRARINAIKHILSQIEYPEKIDSKAIEVDSAIACSADEIINAFDGVAELDLG